MNVYLEDKYKYVYHFTENIKGILIYFKTKNYKCGLI